MFLFLQKCLLEAVCACGAKGALGEPGGALWCLLEGEEEEEEEPPPRVRASVAMGQPTVPFGLFCLNSCEMSLRNHQHSSLRVQKQHKLAALNPGPITFPGVGEAL